MIRRPVGSARSWHYLPKHWPIGHRASAVHYCETCGLTETAVPTVLRIPALRLLINWGWPMASLRNQISSLREEVPPISQRAVGKRARAGIGLLPGDRRNQSNMRAVEHEYARADYDAIAPDLCMEKGARGSRSLSRRTAPGLGS